jgi:hypothetical protein
MGMQMGIFEKLTARRMNRQPGLPEVVEQMRRLASTGRIRDAIDYAQPHALRLGQPELHRELTHLRRTAAEEAIREARPRPDWPPLVPDPFPDCESIPEIDCTDLTTELMQGAIQHHGSLLVRGVIDRHEAMAITADIDRVLDALERRIQGSHVQDDEAWFSPFDLKDEDDLQVALKWLHETGGVMAADSPMMFNRLAELYRRSGLVSAIEDHLGERPLLSVGKTVMRRVKLSAPADFHQDGSFLGTNVRTINVWIALSDCGVNAPGLDVVDCRVPDLVEMGTGGARFSWSVGQEVALSANGGRPFARPVFRPGDALMFDQLMLHSTTYDPAMTGTRYALESWFFAPSAYTEQQVALLL